MALCWNGQTFKSKQGEFSLIMRHMLKSVHCNHLIYFLWHATFFHHRQFLSIHNYLWFVIHYTDLPHFLIAFRKFRCLIPVPSFQSTETLNRTSIKVLYSLRKVTLRLEYGCLWFGPAVNPCALWGLSKVLSPCLNTLCHHIPTPLLYNMALNIHLNAFVYI